MTDSNLEFLYSGAMHRVSHVTNWIFIAVLCHNTNIYNVLHSMGKVD